MDKKISQLTSAASLTGTEIIPLVQSGQTVSATTQDIADLSGVPKQYTVRFVFNQTTIVDSLELFNNTGETITIAAIGSSTGFSFTASGAVFTADKTFVILPGAYLGRTSSVPSVLYPVADYFSTTETGFTFYGANGNSFPLVVLDVNNIIEISIVVYS